MLPIPRPAIKQSDVSEFTFSVSFIGSAVSIVFTTEPV
eukprot:COSAG05_NODE_10987_length_536_cov_0.732265_2_plen_37_part_01